MLSMMLLARVIAWAGVKLRPAKLMVSPSRWMAGMASAGLHAAQYPVVDRVLARHLQQFRDLRRLATGHQVGGSAVSTRPQATHSPASAL